MIKTVAREIEDWAALALALDAELHLLHRAGTIDGIPALFTQMQECTTKSDMVAASVANASLAMNVLFGDSDEGLRCAEAAVHLAEQAGDAGVHLLALNRLVIAHTARGALNMPGPSAILAKARCLAESSGDLQQRFDLV